MHRACSSAKVLLRGWYESVSRIGQQQSSLATFAFKLFSNNNCMFARGVARSDGELGISKTSTSSLEAALYQ